MTLKFSYDEINKRYEEFIGNFMIEEQGVKREKILPHFYIVSIPSKKFNVSITCECIGNIHGVEEWCAVVKESNGERINYPLFRNEIDNWLVRQRNEKGSKNNE